MDETTVGHECATCHAPIEADVWAIGRHHCPACNARHEAEWQADTQHWINTHAVSYRVDGGPKNMRHVTELRALFLKKSKRTIPNLLGIEEEKT